MLKRMLTHIIIGSSILISLNASAASSYFEARSDAMGGTGVASSNYGVAPLSNPALLAKYPKKDLFNLFSLLLPAVGLEIAFPSDTLDKVQNVQKSWETFESSTKGDDLDAIKASATKLKTSLKAIDNTTLSTQAGSPIVLAIPNDTLAFAFMVNSYAIASASLNIADSDLDYLQQVADGNQEANIDKLNSGATAKSAFITDIGVSLARKIKSFKSGMQLAVGITPKMQQVNIGSYKFSLSEGSDNALRSRIQNENLVNADVGAYLDLPKNITVGASVKNIIPYTVSVTNVDNLSDSLAIRPQVVTGVSWAVYALNVAFDVELSPESGFQSDSKKQFASLGTEINAFKFLQVRGGYRQNMRATGGNAFTGGLGLSPFNLFHLDVTGMLGTDSSYGLVTQLNFTF